MSDLKSAIKYMSELQKIQNSLEPGGLNLLKDVEMAVTAENLRAQAIKSLPVGYRHLPFETAIAKWDKDAKAIADATKALDLLYVSSKPVVQQLSRFVVETRAAWQSQSTAIENAFRQYQESDLAVLRAQLAKPAQQIAQLVDGLVNSVGKRVLLIDGAWIAHQMPGASMSAFAQIVSMAEQIKTAHPFSEGASRGVNELLGPWLKLPATAGLDLSIDGRIAFAEGQGFDTGLLAIPPAAFPQAVDATGLAGPVAQLLDEENEDAVPPVVLTGHPGEIISEAHHGHIFRLIRTVERQFRVVLNTKMPERFGPDWMKQNVDGTLRQKWEVARSKEKPPKSDDLLDYSDFGELLSVMLRGDAWKQVFEPIFHRKNDFEVSFQRLLFVRNPNSHGRPLTRHDYLIALTESERMLMAIGYRTH